VNFSVAAQGGVGDLFDHGSGNFQVDWSPRRFGFALQCPCVETGREARPSFSLELVMAEGRCGRVDEVDNRSHREFTARNKQRCPTPSASSHLRRR
jgi:hypothetical protein